jgi:competence protein ComEC
MQTEKSLTSSNVLPMRRPLISLAVVFGFGIWLSNHFSCAGWIYWPATGLFALVTIIFARLQVGGASRFILWLIVFLLLGLGHGRNPKTVVVPPEGSLVMVGQAQTGWEKKKNRQRLVIDLQAIKKAGESFTPTSRRIRLTLVPESIFDHNQVEKDPFKTCSIILPGDRIRVQGKLRLPGGMSNPGVVDYGLLLQRRGIEWTATTDSCAKILVEAAPQSFSLARVSESIRSNLQDFFLGHADSQIVIALTTGERGLIEDQVRDNFQKAGLAHLLAISGLHMGFVALGLCGLFIFLLRRIPQIALRVEVRRLAAGLTIPLTLLYAMMTGGQLSAIRAAIMVICFLVSILVRRESDPLHTLAAAFLVILGIWPQSLFEVSFQLSFVAVFFIIIGMPLAGEWLRIPIHPLEDWGWRKRISLRITQFVLVSLFASIATAPLTAYYFNQLSTLGLLANIVAVPFVTFLIVPLSLLAALLVPVSSYLAGIITDGAIFLTQGLSSWADLVAGIEWVSIYVITPSVFEIWFYYGVLILLVYSGRFVWLRKAALTGAVVLVALIVISRLDVFASDELEVTFIDVGQGDSVFVKLPNNKTMLIDGGLAVEGGFDVGRYVVAPFLWGQGVADLDIVAISHPDTDHASGLASTIKLFKPKEIWTIEPLEKHELTNQLAAIAKGVEAKVKIVRSGDVLLDNDGCRLEALWPSGNLDEFNDNERSMVLAVEYGSHTFLLTGDLEGSGEEALIKTSIDLSSSVLKVGHHGSRNATGQDLLDRVKPGYAVVSVGLNNFYRHPHPQVLERLRQNNVSVFRTDLHGAVKFTTDGKKLEVEKNK